MLKKMEQQQPTGLEVRPGFARRTEAFPELVSQAQAYEADPDLTKDALYRAVSLGLAGVLSDKEHRFLCIAVSMLNRRSLERGLPHCYLGGYLFCQALGGISMSTLSRIKRSLEAKGLIIRHYDKRNRPLEKASIDLRPLLQRLEEFQERAELLFEASRARFEEAQTIDVHDYEGNDEMAGCHLCHPNSPSPNLIPSTVQTNAESQPSAAISKSAEDQPTADPGGKNPPTAIQSGNIDRNQHCSPKETSDFWRRRGQLSKGLSTKARSELLEAHRLSPTLSNYLDAADIEKGELKRVYEACLEVIQAHFNPQRNTDMTFKWAVGKFGWRAVLILVCALEDPSVRSPEKWFGWAATRMPKTADLSDNLRRIACHLDAPETVPDNAEDDCSPLAGNPTSPGSSVAGNDETEAFAPTAGSEPGGLMERAKALLVEKGLVKPAEIAAWFGEITIANVTRDRVQLSAPSLFLANWIKDNYSDELTEVFTALLERPVTPRIAVAQKPKVH
ncbi:DnaA N-terminal domain-containing protein [Pelagibius sp. Alg239-R121]|uniref:DnaA N-terminal domain-containing protein n=1 Tax=Pelagibius sp. Alg239-R121 TaxID=2993448 RepID=UPI0024A748F5|nr:DnaA N-terminal domain-containing protein [Pelagibius sp. Alg239-R121]